MFTYLTEYYANMVTYSWLVYSSATSTITYAYYEIYSEYGFFDKVLSLIKKILTYLNKF
jgi:hypothetical protein